MSNGTIKIGTRDSKLALWQANTVAKQLNDLGHKTEIVAVKSTGDIILDKPLYELGITGIFTKTLDVALLNEEIDIAVHSMKDVPTQLPFGVVQLAVLERASTLDLLISKDKGAFLQENNPATIATGSLRRKAQWLNKYPKHSVVDLRGNVQTRMQKLTDNNWQGAIFAAAGLERLNESPKEAIALDWMVPAPAQGAIVIVGLEKNTEITEKLQELNHQNTEVCTHIERQFLRTLEGGCTAPIGALATVENNAVLFKGTLHSLDGKEAFSITKSCNLASYKNFGTEMANELLSNGAKPLMERLKKELKVK